jgi:hypothetical protein
MNNLHDLSNRLLHLLRDEYVQSRSSGALSVYELHVRLRPADANAIDGALAFCVSNQWIALWLTSCRITDAGLRSLEKSSPIVEIRRTGAAIVTSIVVTVVAAIITAFVTNFLSLNQAGNVKAEPAIVHSVPGAQTSERTHLAQYATGSLTKIDPAESRGLLPGQAAVICAVEPSVPVFSKAAHDSPPISRLPSDQLVNIVSGPLSDGRYLWWEVVLFNGTVIWLRESRGDPNARMLCP